MRPCSRAELAIWASLLAGTPSCAPPREPAATRTVGSSPTTKLESTPSPSTRLGGDDQDWTVLHPSDLRELTFIVAVTPPPVIAAAYVEIGSQYRDLQPLMKAHNEGGFGSGFLMVARSVEGRELGAYVVTNQHVVGLASEVSLGRHDSEARATSEVVYVDPLYDLAIVELSAEAKALFHTEGGLGFSSDIPKDQDAVVASGFPGIEGEPSYQVTRGYVSNQRVLIDLEGTELPHIQHTAPIDSGSSGGPLLDEQNRLLGINTLKVRWREGVGLAVPAPAIRAALTKLLETNGPTRQERAQQSCERLLVQLQGQSVSDRAGRLMSAELVAKEGARSLWLLPEDGTEWIAEFVVDPAQVMAHALLLRFRRELAANLTSRACEPEPEARADTETFAIMVGSTKRLLSFAEEQGTFKLRGYDFTPGSGRTFLPPKKASARKWKPSL